MVRCDCLRWFFGLVLVDGFGFCCDEATGATVADLIESVSFTSEGDVLCYPRFTRASVGVSIVALAGWIIPVDVDSSNGDDDIPVDVESSDDEVDAVEVSDDVFPPWFNGSIFILVCAVCLCSMIVVPAGINAVVQEAPLRLHENLGERLRWKGVFFLPIRRCCRPCRRSDCRSAPW